MNLNHWLDMFDILKIDYCQVCVSHTSGSGVYCVNVGGDLYFYVWWNDLCECMTASLQYAIKKWDALRG